MADALVSVVMEQLSLMFAQEVQQEVRLVVGVKNEVKKLTSNFQAIQAVLADAEERQLKDGSIQRWIDQLKGVSYDMDDVLDEWGTAIAKSQMKVNEHPRKTARKVCSMIFSCLCFREVGLRRDIAHKIKELNERIDGIVIEKDRFHFKSSEVGIKQLEYQKTTSVIDATETKGREKDKDRVMNMLLSQSSQGPALRTISLVGMGGIGKTTLAQLVYNDHKVATHFKKRIWVCVSDPFDEIRIAKAILEAFKVSASDAIELQTLDARHTMVVFGNYNTYSSFPATIHKFKKLRSLIVDGRPSSMNAALPNLIANLSCLRTLRLSGCGIEEVPSNIGKLIHLRHVDLSENEIRELPEEMCELYNMLTLDVSFCQKLERLPDNIGRLVKLRHLKVFIYRHDSWFVKMRGFEGLSSLRELDEFHVSGSGEVSNIEDLRNLNHLQGSLTISWLGDVKDPNEVKRAEFKRKKHLTRLDLWFDSRTDRRIIRDVEVLEALEPNPNVDSLAIGCYQGIIRVFPSWINKIKVVRLFKWGKIENLPPLGKLQSLEKLTVEEMECIKKVGHEFLGMKVDDDDDCNIRNGEMAPSPSPSNTIIAFPKLKSLTFIDMKNWEEWEGRGGNEDKTNIFNSIIMPSLRYLELVGCPKLKAVPDYVLQSTTFRRLHADNCESLRIPRNTSHHIVISMAPNNMGKGNPSEEKMWEDYLGKLPSLEKLRVYGMGCVGRMGREFLGLGVDSDISNGEMTSSSSFPKLESLSFWYMGEWKEWEGGEKGNEDKTNISISTKIMPSLHYLKIVYCLELKALLDYVLQSTTLEQLTIKFSPIIGAQFKAGGKGWPNTSHTPTITFEELNYRSAI
uniref:Disease resistance protein RGA3 n=1 Tax=Populus alba TaxID=43335 RepID=A0A4U5Q426_POPAL|nr:hypothetical protein D5086_0000138000 [Populus alba]